MNKKSLVIAVVVSFVVAMMMSLFNVGKASAQECRLIKIHGRTEHPSLAIEPQTSFISKGDCVVWFNRVFTDEVMVIFKEGKKCLDVTKAPMGFTLDAETCYVTSWIPFAGTTSLRFMEKGTYEYTVKAKDWKGITATGRIVVE
jgi:hypothetical protein